MAESTKSLDLSWLAGEHVALWPYVRGLYPRGILAKVWEMLESEHAADRIFFGAPRQLYPERSTETRGDLVDVVRYFEPEPPGSRALLLVESVEDRKLAGCIWFDEIVPGHRANANVFARRSSWGAPAREASHIACRWAFEVLGVRTLWAFTPWPLAWRHAEAAGFRREAVLPGYCRMAVEGGWTVRDLVVLRLRQEDFDAEGWRGNNGQPPQ